MKQRTSNYNSLAACAFITLFVAASSCTGSARRIVDERPTGAIGWSKAAAANLHSCMLE